MFMKYFKNSMLFYIFALMILLVGCSHHVPKPDAIEFAELQKSNDQILINIINDQNNADQILIGRYGVGTLRGDLHSWTDSAVKLLKDTFEEKGITVSDEAPKFLKIKVTEAKVDTAGIPFVASLARCKILLSIETGDCYFHTYEATNKALNPPWASDKAMTSVVSALLKDQAILKYLKK